MVKAICYNDRVLVAAEDSRHFSSLLGILESKVLISLGSVDAITWNRGKVGLMGNLKR